MDFSWTLVGAGARIDEVREAGAVIVFPEEIEGHPVTELGAYVLSGSPAEEVYLPAGLRKIGAYAFYNCEKLRKLSCYGRVLDLGAGIFAGAGGVEQLDITLFENERSCFKDLLSELRQTLRVRVREGGLEARLIFPEYFEESVENTPARILFIETHGCGHRYRYCFVNTHFQYKDYDRLFAHVKVQEPEELVTELALGRLWYPLDLTGSHRKIYEDYVAEHWQTAGKLLIGADRPRRGQASHLEPGRLPWLVEEILAGAAEGPEALPSQIGRLITLAQQAGDTEMVSWLMEYGHLHGRAPEGGRKRRRFEL